MGAGGQAESLQMIVERQNHFCSQHLSFSAYKWVVFSCSVLSTSSLQLYALKSTSLFYPWNSPIWNTRAGCHFLL